MPKHPSVLWNGEKWYFWTDYYKNRKGKLLHRAKYEYTHGPIPEGNQIHHIDGDKSNNAIENLVSLSVSEHIKLHPRGYVGWDSEQRSAATRAQWERTKPRTVTCSWCGNEYTSTGTRAKFCHPSCRQAELRHRRRTGS
ncbi:MAG: HNH endonuclease [Actinobacteria bacterium]|nr:HNH endonuclease [Actinomycetota bacterium]